MHDFFEDIREIADARDDVAVEDDDAGEKPREDARIAARKAWEASPEGVEWRRVEKQLLDKELAECVVS